MEVEVFELKLILRDLCVIVSYMLDFGVYTNWSCYMPSLVWTIYLFYLFVNTLVKT